VACAATGPLVSWAGVLSRSGTGLSASVPPGRSALQGLAGWAWIVAITGFGSIAARRRHRQDRTDTPPAAAPGPRWRRAAQYGNEAVLPFCLLHEPVIAAAAWFTVRCNAPALAQYAALAAASFAATSALYDLAVRRSGPARLPPGMKPRRSAPAMTP
jgi:hypothetical protein